MRNSIIKVENLTKTYPIYESKKDRMKEALSPTRKQYHHDFNALKSISFSIQKGETIGIIGQNGSGKSTLLKILTGVINPTSGSFLVNGRISALLELGAGFNPEMTGIENIYLNGTIMGYSKEEMDERVPKIVDFADIGDFIKQPVKMYSSGMFARLAFAVAINVDPDILIVDEALSVGDVFFQSKCFKKFEEFRASGKTILFVSHDMSSVKQLCDRVLWINSGEIVAYGEKEVVCEKYLTDQLVAHNRIYSKNVENESTEKYENIVSKEEKVVFSKNIFPKESDLLSDKVSHVSFFIKDKDGNFTHHLKTGESYTFHSVAEIYEDLDDLIFGISLDDRKGVPLLVINTFMNTGKNIVAKKGQIIENIFTVDLPKIMQGEYLVSIGSSQGTQKNHIRLTRLNNFTSLTIENDGYNFSLIELNSKIYIKEYSKSKVVVA